jgi:hypothetical protein
MGFFFKGDQLYTRRGQLQDEDVTAWTSILMDMRQPITIPEMTGFAKFLTCSLVSTFFISPADRSKLVKSLTEFAFFRVSQLI